MQGRSHMITPVQQSTYHAVPALGVDGLEALDVAVGRDLQVVLDVEPVALLLRRLAVRKLPIIEG
jgi:hypothetical protein